MFISAKGVRASLMQQGRVSLHQQVQQQCCEYESLARPSRGAFF